MDEKDQNAHNAELVVRLLHGEVGITGCIVLPIFL